MAKIIDFYTRKEITEPQHTKAEGEALIENLLEYELAQSDQAFGCIQLVSDVITIIEGATGASRYEVMDKIYGARKA